MSAKHTDYKLHELLLAFLKKDKVNYVPIEAEVVSDQPLRISQDGLLYLELTNLSSILAKEPTYAAQSTGEYHRTISFQEWCFVFCQVPNTSDFYLDLNVQKYNFNDYLNTPRNSSVPLAHINILDTNTYKKLYEEEKIRLAQANTDEGANGDTGHRKGISNVNQAQSLEKQQGDQSEGSKYPLRRRTSNNKLSATKESEAMQSNTQQGRRGETSQTGSQIKSLTGIGITGLNGRENMRKIRDLRQNYITASQDSITEQMMQGGRLKNHSKPDDGHETSALAANKQTKPLDSSSLQKRNTKDLSDIAQTSHPRSAKKTPDTSRPLNTSQVSNIDENIQKDLISKRKSVEFQRLGLQLNDSSPLSYDELMECLSVEKRLVRWEDMIFSKDVVKLLKKNIDDFMDTN